MKIKYAVMAALLQAAVALAVSARSGPPLPVQSSQAQASQAQSSQAGVSPETEREPRRRPDVMGKITAIQGQTLTIKNPEGHDVTVTVTDSTRVMKDRQPAKLTDFKVGDMAMVRGKSTGTDAWEADFLGSRGGGFGGPGGGQGGFAEDMGNKFIMGEIKAIDGTHLTIARVDNQTQIIAVDENTSFRKEGESITLADFKVGDHVFGPGEVKDGTFVASRLMLGDPRRMRGGPEGEHGPGGEQKPN